MSNQVMRKAGLPSPSLVLTILISSYSTKVDGLCPNHFAVVVLTSHCLENQSRRLLPSIGSREYPPDATRDH